MINIASLISRIQNAQNPMQMIFNIFQQNPNFKKVMDMVNGKSPQEIEELVRNTAKTQGLDINDVFKKLGLNMPSPSGYNPNLNNK